MLLGINVALTIVEGRAANFVMMIFMFMCICIPLYLTSKGRISPHEKLVRIPALDAIDDSVGRAAEMGRPILFSIGAYAKLRDDASTQTMAGIDILSHVARQAAKTETPLYTCTGQAESFALLLSTVEEAYKAEGREDLFDESKSFWWSDEFAQYYAGLLDLCFDIVPATVIFAGAVSWEPATISTELHAMGALLIGGTGRVGASCPELIAIGCDHQLIVEEMYVASAYLSGDPIESASILGQDYIKMSEIGLIIVGVLFAFLGSTFIKDLLLM